MNNLKASWMRLEELIDLNLRTSSRLEKENSKNPFPSEEMPHLLRELQRVLSLDLKQATMSEDEPFGQMILP